LWIVYQLGANGGGADGVSPGWWLRVKPNIRSHLFISVLSYATGSRSLRISINRSSPRREQHVTQRSFTNQLLGVPSKIFAFSA
jgi:hypothetical protein